MTPAPPPDLAKRIPLVETLAPDVEIHRFYTAAHHPFYFDRSAKGRFNASDGAYGVLYAAKSERGAFAETFLRVPGSTLIAADFLARKAYVRMKTTREMRFIRFAGPGLALLGATAEVVHGGLPYDVPQAWSAALYDHPSMADGIAYNARHDDEASCYAVFERAAGALHETHRLVDLDVNWFWDVAEVYGVGLAP